MSTPTFSPHDFYTSREVADAFQVSTSTLVNWRAKGIGPDFVKISETSIRYSGQALNEYLDELNTYDE